MGFPKLTPQSSLPPRETCPEGTYQGELIRAYYIGTQVPKNPAYKPSKKIMLVWEIDEPRTESDGNHLIITTVTYSLNEKSGLTRLLKPVLGKSFPVGQNDELDIPAMIGSRMMVAVTHSDHEGKTYANVASISPLPRGMAPFQATQDAFAWAYDDPADERVPEWVREKANECLELKNAQGLAEPETKVTQQFQRPVTLQPRQTAPAMTQKDADQWMNETVGATRVADDEIPF